MRFCKWHMRVGAAFILLAGSFFIIGAFVVAGPEYSKIIQEIAQDIAKLKPEFTQLKRFSPSMCVDLERLTISYSYSTHQPQHRAGWTAGVPNPNADGIWFYIDVHDPDSQAQIHTQPVAIPLCIGDKRISFLLLEGKKTKSVGDRIRAILRKHGIVYCMKSRT